jgi:fumarate reductase subunit D
MTRAQLFLLQGVFAILVIGVLLPLGLLALFLMVNGASLSSAVDRGELYLAGGTASFAASVGFVAARQHQPFGSLLSLLFVVAFVVLPCYALAALCNVHATIDEPLADKWVIGLGAIYGGIGVLVALALVWWSTR